MPRKYKLPPVGPSLERYEVYETRTKVYVVASDRSRKTFRILKIDRSSPPVGSTEYTLDLKLDSSEYNQNEVNALLQTIHEGNQPTGLKLVKVAHAVLGFIRFLNGYYMILVTKRRQVGSIGRHKVYTIEAAELYYIHLEKSINSTTEERYLSLFSCVDLTKDFYFSYTYDLSRSLQYNMNPENHTKDFPNFNETFVWNLFLLEHLLKLVRESESVYSQLWIVPIIHGYFNQAKMEVYDSNVELTLISRRLTVFAGTRYLKRGINERGYVANDVETEQILCIPNTGNYVDEYFTAFIQHRGSIPLYWAQDNTGGVPKPPIEVQRIDPFYTATILHFKDLLQRYGAPIVVLNLVKSEEKNPRETLLKEGFDKAIDFINSTIKDEGKKIIYTPWDFKKISKDKAQVLRDLNKISQNAMEKIGFFHSGREPYAHTLREKEYPCGGIPYGEDRIGREQRGVLRSNCIDSLDRTNAAQYCVGQCALGYQLHALGLTQSPMNNFESHMSKLLMLFYEASGHKLALQYGGSELAHTMSTWHTNKVLDTLTSIKRYYNNVFSDQEKQMSMNLFLGIFRPENSKPSIWNIETDYFLHMAKPERKLLCNTEWWSTDYTKDGTDAPSCSYTTSDDEDEAVEDFHLLQNSEPPLPKLPNISTIVPTDRSLQIRKEFDEFYETDVLTEFEPFLELEFNKIVRTSSALPAISAVNEKNEEEDNPGLRWGIGYWLRFDALKRKKKKLQDLAISNETSNLAKLSDSLYNPLRYYGITIEDNENELNDYLNYSSISEANQQNKKAQYTSYISSTHGKKPNILESPSSSTEQYKNLLNQSADNDHVRQLYDTYGSYFNEELFQLLI